MPFKTSCDFMLRDDVFLLFNYSFPSNSTSLRQQTVGVLV